MLWINSYSLLRQVAIYIWHVMKNANFINFIVFLYSPGLMEFWLVWQICPLGFHKNHNVRTFVFSIHILCDSSIIKGFNYFLFLHLGVTSVFIRTINYTVSIHFLFFKQSVKSQRKTSLFNILPSKCTVILVPHIIKPGHFQLMENKYILYILYWTCFKFCFEYVTYFKMYYSHPSHLIDWLSKIILS